MITVVKTYEETENGVVYVVEELSNGGIMKTVKSDPDIPEPEPLEPELSEEAQAMMEMAMNMEYMMELMEMEVQ